MPALPKTLINDLEERLTMYLESSGGFDDLTFLDAGGSAAVFKVQRGDGFRAVKVFDPELFTGEHAAASRRRLEVQRRLVDHHCPNLIQTFFAAEVEGTAFIEMEFVDWPQLTKCLSLVPDEAIRSLIGQLIAAVRYLEQLNIVHRDIKPENIHVSSDFKFLKLLDLGVAREMAVQAEDDGTITDSGSRRPFLATAQYSSPEYLFRLDEPTEKLWRGLNLYQVGAVLHDLINKEPLFNNEVSVGNRWLVARAVLTTTPSFSDTNLSRLLNEKSVALKCLTKDLDTRLELVNWEDFQFDDKASNLESLATRLSKPISPVTNQLLVASANKLDYERCQFLNIVYGRVRTELLGVLQNRFVLAMQLDAKGANADCVFKLTVCSSVGLAIICRPVWKAHLHAKCANVMLGAQFFDPNSATPVVIHSLAAVFEAVVGENENELVYTVSNKIAEIVGIALDIVETTESDMEKLKGMQLFPNSSGS
ncbi:protein kinase domain-containing protein [Limnobacter sp.]|uniref:protein kinase domain-containing protein n=1 Tax=Limnobacter sp. TaxID=2003368 RepID=UPI003BABE81C